MKTSYFIYPLFFLPFFSFSQTTTAENGVVVHSATGTGSYEMPAIPLTTVRTLEDWTLPECIDAISEIEDKIYVLNSDDAERRAYYISEKTRIEERRDFLMTNNTH